MVSAYVNISSRNILEAEPDSSIPESLVREPVIVPVREPVIVPVREPVIVPVREPVIVPVRVARDPVMVPPDADEASTRPRKAARVVDLSEFISSS